MIWEVDVVGEIALETCEDVFDPHGRVFSVSLDIENACGLRVIKL